MAMIHAPLPVKLIVGILTSLPDTFSEAEAQLALIFGHVDARSDRFPFGWTRYYDSSMGSPIYRCFLSFAELMEPAALAEAKIKTNALEASFAAKYPDIRRPINLDPGYLEQSKLVLASTKNFYHRILISGGIYAEVTLHFEAGVWRSFPWTFPDYKSERYHPFFAALRDRYREQLCAAGFRIRIPKKPRISKAPPEGTQV